MKVLVTGATGVLGSHVVRELSEQGVEVVGCDLSPPGPSALSPGSRWTFCRGDVTDLSFLVDAIRSRGVTRVIHLAAMLDETCSLRPIAALNVNVRGSLNVFEAARFSGVERVVFASTRAVLPDFEDTEHGYPTHRPVPEEYPPQPTRPYEVMKYACERLALFYRNRHDLETVALRFSMTYCAERAVRLMSGTKSDAASFARRSAGPLHRMIWAAAFGGRVEVGGADRPMDLTYVKDLARGIVLACKAPGRVSPLYHVGSGRMTTVAEVVRTLNEISPETEISATAGLDFGVGHYCLVDIGRAERELGYSPRFSIRTGLEDCCRELRARFDGAKGGRP